MSLFEILCSQWKHDYENVENENMLQKCFRESTLTRTKVFEWHKAINEIREINENLLHYLT